MASAMCYLFIRSKPQSPAHTKAEVGGVGFKLHFLKRLVKNLWIHFKTTIYWYRNIKGKGHGGVLLASGGEGLRAVGRLASPPGLAPSLRGQFEY